MRPLAILDDAPGSTLSERIGFTSEWFKDRARGALECSKAFRVAGLPRSAAVHLGLAGEWRRDAQALSSRRDQSRASMAFLERRAGNEPSGLIDTNFGD